MTLETLKQHSWNLQQNLQQFGDGTVRKVIKTDEGFEKDCGENLSAYAAAPLVKLKQKKTKKTTSMTYNILINQKQFSSLCSFQLGSGGTFYHLSTAVLLLYFTGEKT